MSSFFVTFFFTILLTPLVIKLYQKYRWLDDPEQNHQQKVTHLESVPRGGGLAIMLPVLLATLLFLQIDKYLIAILIGAIILTIVGVIDDIYDISPYWRLLTGLVATLIVVGSGIGIAYVSNPFAGGVIHLDQPQLSFYLLGEQRHVWVLSSLFAIFFIMWNMNIINWSKGVDGQLPGFVSVACLIIAQLASSFQDAPSQFNVTHLALIVAGAFAGLFYWNFYPQRIMPGYGAGSLAGYFLSILAILSGAKVATTLMVLAIPTADGLFTIIRRLAAGKSPFWGDRGHLHHQLMDNFGWGRRRIAVFYILTSLLMGVLSLYLDTKGKLIAIAVSGLFVFAFLLYNKLKIHDNH